MKDIEIDRGQSAADGERNTDSEHLEMAEWKSWDVQNQFDDDIHLLTRMRI